MGLASQRHVLFLTTDRRQTDRQNVSYCIMSKKYAVVAVATDKARVHPGDPDPNSQGIEQQIITPSAGDADGLSTGDYPGSRHPHQGVWKEILFVAILPAVAWSILVSGPPLKPPTKELTWDNVPFLVFFLFAGASSVALFHVLNAEFYPVTIRMMCISSASFVVISQFIFISLMALGVFPLPIFQAVAMDAIWLPLVAGVYYFQLVKSGGIERGVGTAKVFFKLQAVTLIYGSYFALCICYLLTFVVYRRPAQQITIMTTFWISSNVMKHGSMSLAHKLLPTKFLNRGAGEDDYQFRAKLIGYAIYFFLDVCNEVFVTISAFEVSDLASAVFMVSLELISLAASSLKMTSAYFHWHRRHNPSKHLHSTLKSFRVELCEKLALRLISELIACFGVLMLAFSMRFGRNEEFYPLRSNCESEFFFSIYLMGLIFLSVVLFTVGFHFMYKRLFGIRLLGLMAAHLRLNFRMMLGATSSIYIFPVTLLLYHMYVLPAVDKASYVRATEC